MALAKTEGQMLVSREEHEMEIPSLVGAPGCKQPAVSQGACFRERKLGSVTEILREAGGEQEGDSMQRRSHSSMCQ